MESVFIGGVAQSSFGKDERPLEEIMAETGKSALGHDSPNAVVIGNFNSQGYVGQASLDALVANRLGISTTTPVFHINRGSSTGAAAVELGYKLASNGDKVLVISGEKMRGEGNVAAETSKVIDKAERNYGATMPVIAALATSEYMLRWGINEKKLRDIFFQTLNRNRRNGFANPYAYLKDEISNADYFDNERSENAKPKNPWVAWPLTRNDCGGTYDGAAAVVLTSEESDLKLAGIASAHSSVSISSRRTLVSLDSTVDVARELYHQTGISPSEIDIVELHDAFAPVPIIAAEDLGIAKRSEGSKIALGLGNKYGKKIFYNLSGGFLCKTHPIAASGTAQLVELALQMRGEYQYEKIIGNQVEDINIGLWFSMNGFGFYNVAGIVEKTGKRKDTATRIELPERYKATRNEKGRLIAITNLLEPVDGHNAVGLARYENRMQLGLLKEFDPNYLGRKVNENNGSPRVGFEPVNESIISRIGDAFYRHFGIIRGRFDKSRA